VTVKGRVDELCLGYFCERCGAAPGIWCHTTTGDRATFLHASRFTQAVEAGDLPLED